MAKTKAQVEKELDLLQYDVSALFNSILERMTIEELVSFRGSLEGLINEKIETGRSC